MSNCEKYLDMISAYIDSELSETGKTELEAHLEICSECRSILETYRAISSEMALDTEETPDGFSEGIMEKVASYEKNKSAGGRRRKLGIAGRWIGIAACIAIVLMAFPRMPGLGCGASRDTAVETITADADMDKGADFDVLADGSGAAPAEPEYAVDDFLSFSDAAADSIVTESEETKNTANGNAMLRADIGMVVTICGVEVPEKLLNADYEITYHENGDVEYLVPVSVAREIMNRYDNAEVEVLDTDIDGMMAKIIIKN